MFLEKVTESLLLSDWYKQGIAIVQSAAHQSICKKHWCFKVQEGTNSVQVSYMESGGLYDSWDMDGER